MTNLHAELRVTLTENGIPDASPLLEYMDWAGIRTKNSLAMFFTDTDKITEWIEKFQNEITFGTPEKKIHLPEDDRRKGLLGWTVGFVKLRAGFSMLASWLSNCKPCGKYGISMM